MSLSICASTAKWGEQFFLIIKLLESCVRAQSSPVAARAPAWYLQGLTQREHGFSFAFLMYSAAKCAFEGILLMLGGALDAEGNFLAAINLL